MGLSGAAVSSENIMVHKHIPAGDLTKSSLSGQSLVYEYTQAVSITPKGAGDYEAISFGETVEVVFSDEWCTYYGIVGKFKGESERSACGQKEIAPGIHFVTWLEATGQLVTLVINLNAKTINASFLSRGPTGLDNVEFLHGVVHNAGSHKDIKALTGRTIVNTGKKITK